MFQICKEQTHAVLHCGKCLHMYMQSHIVQYLELTQGVESKLSIGLTSFSKKLKHDKDE